MKNLVTHTVLRALFVVFAATAMPLFAQTAQTPQEQNPGTTTTQQDDTQPPKLEEEMVVTARKREETVQEVPISVAAPTESELRDVGAETIEDIASNVAGFTVQNLGPGQSQVAMRGVSAGQIVRDQPGVKEQVGVYLDESVISLSLFTPDVDLFDLSRVEVLRGPQGTLFGSGSLSGTVRYISNQPRLGINETVGELSLNSISDGELGGSAKAAVNFPMGDRAAMRVVAYYTRYGGFIDAVQPNLSLNENVNSGTRAGARLAFRFEPSDRLRITPRLIYQQVEMNGWNRIDVFNILGNPYTTTRPAVQLGERRQFTQFEEPFSDQFLLGDLNLEYDLGGMTLTSVTSYIDRDVLVVRDATALTASITGGSIGLPASVYTLDAPLDDTTTAQSFTQEVRLSGGSDRFDWVGGVFYTQTDRHYDQSLLVSGFSAGAGFPTRGIRAATDELFYSDLNYDFAQTAIFGETTFGLGDRLDLTAGLRYYNFEEDRDQVFDGIFGNDNNGTSLVQTQGSTSADGFAPRVMASFRLSEGTRLNAQVAKGFRLGGINDPLNVPLCTAQDLATFGGRDTWEDEELWNYEIGTKSTFMGGRGTVNASAFRADIENLQATVTAGSCSSRVIFNVPKARSTGVEVEFDVAPTDNFDFAISASRISSKLRSTLTSTNASGQTSVVAGIQAGARLPTVPEFQLAAAASYRRPFVQNMVGYVTAAYQHIGNRFTQIGDQAPGFGTVSLRAFDPNNIGGPYTRNTINFDPRLPGYDTLNLRVGLLRNNWDTALFVNNITDERAFLALDQERGTRARVGYLTNQPRTIGISTRFNF